VHAGHLAAMPADYPPDLVDEVRKLRELIEGLAVKLNGIPADVFAGEQRRAG
jgi:hypothetical protein